MSSRSPVQSAQYELSATQRAVWRAQQGRPTRASATARLVGALDRDRLIASIDDVRRQHDALSTAVVTLPSGAPVLEWRDGSDGPEQDDACRIELVKARDDEHELRISAASVCVDGPSLDEVLRQIRHRYGGGDLLAEPVSSLQFGEWHRAHVASPGVTGLRGHWPELSGGSELPPPWRPADRGDVSPQSLALSLMADVYEAIDRLRGQTCASAADVVLALWRGFWARLGAEAAQPIDLDIDLRREPELERAIGPLTIPAFLSIGVSLRDTAASLTEAVRRQREQIESIADACPRLGETLADTRDAVSPVGFVHRHDPDVEMVSGVRFEIQPAAIWLGRNAYRMAASGGMHLHLEYDAGQVTSAQAARLAACWTRFLAVWASDVHKPLRQIDVRPAEEAARAAHHLERPAIEASGGADLMRHLASHASSRESAVAVRAGEVRLTYGELFDWMRRIRFHVDAHATSATDPLAVVSHRTAETIAAMLSAFSCGRPYVPLNPDQPKERVAAILRNAGIRLVAGNREHLAALPSGEWRLLPLEEAIATPCQEDPRMVHARHHPEMPAYVIHTSGSTGTPKAVAVSRGALLHSTLARLRQYEEPVRGFLLISPLHFDSSIAGVYWTLAQGGAITLPADEGAGDPDVLLRLIGEDKISHLLCVPSFYALLLDVASGQLEKLCTVIVAGEACPAALVERHLRLLPDVPLYNEYGPTEAAVWSTVERCARVESPVSIGTPIAGARLRILDDALVPVPFGAPGELYIAGEGVALGYWNQPELTADRFLPDLEAAAPGARMYRTGDRVSLREDGRLEFHGRTDRQVKIRGHRIEPGEIESALLGCAGVKEAAVTAVEREGETVLAAHVACEPGVSAEAVRASLTGRVPAPLLPSTIHLHERLPRNPNGKVDHRALAAEARQRSVTRQRAAARSPLEHLLLELWREQIGGETLGIDDDFFAAGGDSIRGILLVNRVKERFGADVTVAPTTHATVARMADHLQRNWPDAVRAGLMRTTVEPRIPTVEREAGRGYELSFAQQRVWLAHQIDPHSSAYNIGGAFRVRGMLDPDILRDALQVLVERHEALRTRVRMTVDGPVQEVTERLPIALDVVDATLEDERALQRLIQQRIEQPFQLDRAPLFAATLLQRAGGDRVLILRVHHLVADAWALAICAREMATAYDALAGGRAPVFAPLAVQPIDVAIWQRERYRQGALRPDLDHWVSVLTPRAPELRLPTIGDRTRRTTDAGGYLSIDVPAALIDRVNDFCRGCGVTPFTAWVAALGGVLAAVAGAEDVTIGVNTTGRERREIEPLVGFFLNQLVLRLRMRAGVTFDEHLRQTNRVVSDALAHQDLPYEVLMAEWQARHGHAAAPPFRVKLDYQEYAPIELRTASWSAEEIPLAIATSHFDWVLQITRHAGGGRVAAYYSTELLSEDLVRRWTTACVEVMRLALDDSHQPLEAIARLGLDRAQPPRPPRLGLRQLQRDTLRRLTDPSAAAASIDLVRVIDDGARLPMTIVPARRGVDLAGWMRLNQPRVERWLDERGAILFRGFAPGGEAAVQDVAEAAGGPLVEYRYASTPRTRLQGLVYTSTEYPADRTIPLHNEMSYAWHWPRRIFFLCVQPAAMGGETPLADSRRVWQRIPARVKAALAAGVRYTRTFGHGIDLGWRDAFHTSDPDRVGEICRESRLDCRWGEQGLLQTSGICPAALEHPRTGEWVWFNQAHLFHYSALAAETQRALLAQYPPEQLPRNATLADGAPIDAGHLAEIRAAFEAETIAFPWEAGDLLMLDNLLVAHGRRPFEGPRKVVVAMTQPDSWTDYANPETGR